jgi:hypothetical protein
MAAHFSGYDVEIKIERDQFSLIIAGKRRRTSALGVTRREIIKRQGIAVQRNKDECGNNWLDKVNRRDINGYSK